jgi:protein-L-isoaspartate(D-aspartate) O-methyltransferase
MEYLRIPGVTVRNADGTGGWAGGAPYDGILVACAAPCIPPALIAQLKAGGCMIVPLEAAPERQELTQAVKLPDGRYAARPLTGVVFVPMTGRIRAGA